MSKRNKFDFFLLLIQWIAECCNSAQSNTTRDFKRIYTVLAMVWYSWIALSYLTWSWRTENWIGLTTTLLPLHQTHKNVCWLNCLISHWMFTEAINRIFPLHGTSSTRLYSASKLWVGPLTWYFSLSPPLRFQASSGNTKGDMKKLQSTHCLERSVTTVSLSKL